MKSRLGCAEPRINFTQEVNDTMSEPELHNFLDDVFDRLGNGDHLILGVADNLHPGVDLQRLESTTERIEAFGPVSPRVN